MTIIFQLQKVVYLTFKVVDLPFKKKLVYMDLLFQNAEDSVQDIDTLWVDNASALSIIYNTYLSLVNLLLLYQEK